MVIIYCYITALVNSFLRQRDFPYFFMFLTLFKTFSRSGIRYSHFKDFFINSKPRMNPVCKEVPIRSEGCGGEVTKSVKQIHNEVVRLQMET